MSHLRKGTKIHYANLAGSNLMKCKVELYKAGTVFEEIVIARDYKDAKQTALARNPGATVMGVTAIFE